MSNTTNLKDIIQKSIRDTFEKSAPKSATKSLKENKQVAGTTLKENTVLTAKAFLLKTEFLSSKAKEAHEKIYLACLDATNKLANLISSANPEEAKSTTSTFRSLKIDEQENLNSTKLHEMYFANISDQASLISIDSLPYMRLARDFGTFERWQFDFRGCAQASRDGWAICYYEPTKNNYVNCIVDGDASGVPVGCIPIIVLDMHSHAYYRDYVDDKRSYINSMMRELNWNVIEARMIVAEKSGVGDVFRIMPVQNSEPSRILKNLESGNAPIAQDQIQSTEVITQSSVSQGSNTGSLV